MIITPISFSTHNKHYINTNKTKSLSFGDGLTPELARKIDNTDVAEVEKYFADRNIRALFNGNKVAAGCTKMTADIFDKLNLHLPVAILAFNFSENRNILPPNHDRASGFCCIVPTPIGNEIWQPTSVVFNTKNMMNAYGYDWGLYMTNNARWTLHNHFLGTFLHEFMHSAHYNNLYNKNAGKSDEEMRKILVDLRMKNIDKIKPLIAFNAGRYSASNIYEFIAEEYVNNILKSLDTNTCLPMFDPFEKAKQSRHAKLTRIINMAWDGKTDF